LVAHGNTVARHVYDMAGFEDIGRDDEGWHIMEYAVPSPMPRADPFAAYRAAHARALTAKRVRRRMRLRPSTGPNPARTLGSVRAPPRLCASRLCGSGSQGGNAALSCPP
jgi:hypothetical protein